MVRWRWEEAVVESVKLEKASAFAGVRAPANSTRGGKQEGVRIALVEDAARLGLMLVTQRGSDWGCSMDTLSSASS